VILLPFVENDENIWLHVFIDIQVVPTSQHKLCLIYCVWYTVSDISVVDRNGDERDGAASAAVQSNVYLYEVGGNIGT